MTRRESRLASSRRIWPPAGYSFEIPTATSRCSSGSRRDPARAPAFSSITPMPNAGRWAYDRDSHVGALARGLDEAAARRWMRVVDMKRDWRGSSRIRSSPPGSPCDITAARGRRAHPWWLPDFSWLDRAPHT